MVSPTATTNQTHPDGVICGCRAVCNMEGSYGSQSGTGSARLFRVPAVEWFHAIHVISPVEMDRMMVHQSLSKPLILPDPYRTSFSLQEQRESGQWRGERMM